MGQALGSSEVATQPTPLYATPAATALLGLAQPATLSDLLATVADAERARIAQAIAQIRPGPCPLVVATRLRLRDGRSACAVLQLRRAGEAFALELIDVDGARDTPRLPDAAARLALAAAAGDALRWEWDIDAELPLLSAGFARRLGLAAPPDAQTLRGLLQPDDAAALTVLRTRQRETPTAFSAELRLRDAAGTPAWFRLQGKTRVDERGAAAYLSGSALEIDAEKQAQQRAAQEIERLTREVGELSIRLIDAQEGERRHIARELHDQTGQTLTAAVLDLEFWKDKGVPADEVGSVLATVKQALSEIRNISLQLRPPMLDEHGLEAALKVYLERQAASGKIDVSFAVEGQTRLARHVELTAFRLVQEAVTNILRHAGARHVDVSLRIGANELTLRVSDNGSGCIAQDALGSATGGMSLGLISMRERAKLVGGHCEFISAPAVGSMVLARLPIA